MARSNLQLMVKPQEFFREKIHVAKTDLNLSLDDEVEFYLVNLLCDFIDPNKLNDAAAELDVLDTPMATMLQKALEAPPTQQVKIFKTMGDTSLYFAGFFQDYFNRKAFDINYYISLGSTAYSSVSNLMRDRHGDDHFTDMYEDLSGKFPQLVEILATVSDMQMRDNPNILAIYDRWNRNKSDRLRKTLEKLGINPISTPYKVAQ